VIRLIRIKYDKSERTIISYDTEDQAVWATDIKCDKIKAEAKFVRESSTGRYGDKNSIWLTSINKDYGNKYYIIYFSLHAYFFSWRWGASSTQAYLR
jgi:hypothetical protein